MKFSLNNRAFRAFVALGMAGSLVAGAAIAQADTSSDPNWTVTLSGPSNPSFPLGQVNLAIHVADNSSNSATSGQVAVFEGSSLLATENVNANGDAHFGPSDFVSGDNATDLLAVGAHNLTASYDGNDASVAFTITVGRGQALAGFDSVSANSNGDSATFNWRLSEVGSTANTTFPTGTVSLIEDGNTSAPLYVKVTPSFYDGTTRTASVTGSATVGVEPGTHYYQLYFRGDNNFSINTSAPWSETPFVNTTITWSTLQPGQDSWTVGDTQVDATITPDQFVGQVTGTAHLFDNGTPVAVTQVTSGSDLIFPFAPAAGPHSFTIHFDDNAPFLASDSAVEARTYVGGATTTTTSTTLPSVTSTTVPDTTSTVPDTTTTAPDTTTTVPPSTTTTAPATTTTTTAAVTGPTTVASAPPANTSASSGTNQRTSPSGYRLVAKSGSVTSFGVAGYGDMTGKQLNSPVIAAVDTADGNGYWLLGADGGIFSFGDAAFFGSTGSMHLNAPIVGMAPTPDNQGYWLVASDGGIFSFGDAKFYGSMGGSHLNKPIVGMTAAPDGLGYRLVASDGGIFGYGSSKFFGSMGGSHLNAPIVGMAPTVDGNGYWMVASDGGIFSFGDAKFYGSTGAIKLNQPIVAMLASPTSAGYWFVAADGGVFNYGDAIFAGSLGGSVVNSPIVALA